jgi:hypothetical protein
MEKAGPTEPVFSLARVVTGHGRRRFRRGICSREETDKNSENPGARPVWGEVENRLKMLSFSEFRARNSMYHPQYGQFSQEEEPHRACERTKRDLMNGSSLPTACEA